MITTKITVSKETADDWELTAKMYREKNERRDKERRNTTTTDSRQSRSTDDQ